MIRSCCFEGPPWPAVGDETAAELRPSIIMLDLSKWLPGPVALFCLFLPFHLSSSSPSPSSCSSSVISRRRSFFSSLVAYLPFTSWHSPSIQAFRPHLSTSVLSSSFVQQGISRS